MVRISSRQKNLLILLTCIAISAAGTYALNMHQINKTRAEANKIVEENTQQLKSYLDANQPAVVLRLDLEAGEVIQQANLEATSIPAYVLPENAVTDPSSIVGKTIKLPTKANTILTTDMVYDEGMVDVTDRRVEIDYVRLQTTMTQTDRIDIHIVFPNGEDYIVLGKKKLTGLDLTNQMIFTVLNREEQYLMQSALVDAYINNAELYALPYVEPELQDKASPDYIPNLDVLKVMKANPKIKDTARYAVADALRQSLDARLSAIPDEDKVRVGANLPEGSAVEQRKKTVGASVTVVDPNSSKGTTDQPDNNTPEGFVPAETPTDVGGQ